MLHLLYKIGCNIKLTVYEIDCSNCKAVYFGEYKLSLKSCSDEHERSIRNCDCEKNEIEKHC